MLFKSTAYAALVVAGVAAFAIGSATTGYAKAKKTAAAPPVEPLPCLYAPPGPVCGSLKGHKFTYANSCAAYKDGASIVGHKACPAGKAHRAHKAKSKKAAKKAMKPEKKMETKTDKKM